uniref:Uncharacterized protein n=1 Tax=Tanacetum cinerariifolium TaxID=118510 RepID=A0A6L2M7S0_TANCI|nr:hypothetical protein [Tanacetum cinerariifolium]
MVRDDKRNGMLNDDKGKEKRIMKDKKQKLTGIKELDDLQERIDNVEAVLFKLRDIRLKQKSWSVKEEEPKPLDIPMQTEEEDSIPLDIVYPHPEIALNSRGTNTRGQSQGLRSLGPIQEEVVVVKKPYSLVKVTNVVFGLRAPKAKVRCFGSGRKRNS